MDGAGKLPGGLALGPLSAVTPKSKAREAKGEAKGEEEGAGPEQEVDNVGVLGLVLRLDKQMGLGGNGQLSTVA